MEETNRNGLYAGIGFVAGALVGAGVALILAPKSGKETRGDLLDWLETKRKGGSKILEEGKELVAKGRQELGHKGEQLTAAVRAGREAYRAATNDRKEELVA